MDPDEVYRGVHRHLTQRALAKGVPTHEDLAPPPRSVPHRAAASPTLYGPRYDTRDADQLNRARAAAAEAAGTVGRGLGYAAGAMGVIEGADEWRRHSRTTPEENRAYVGGVRREDLPSVRDAGQRLREGETTYTHVQGHEVQTTRDGHGVHHTVLPPATGHTPDGGPVY